VVIYLHKWLNKKPGQTNFCSQQLQVEAQRDSLAAGSEVGRVDAAASAKKHKLSKINSKDILIMQQKMNYLYCR
jgi:hypothetical protein